METANSAQRDQRIIWHPFTQMQTAQPPLPIVRGEGVWLISENGRRYLDAFSSWWVNLHGHAHPHLVNALVEQAQKLEHVVFTDFTHEPAVRIWQRDYYSSSLLFIRKSFIPIMGRLLWKLP